MSFLAKVPIFLIIVPFFPIIIFFRESLSTIIATLIMFLSLSLIIFSVTQVTECGTSSLVKFNIFSLTISATINSRLLFVVVFSSKYFILSGRYSLIVLISSSTLLPFKAEIGTISLKSYKSLYSFILLNISSLESPSILFITRITSLSICFNLSITYLSPPPKPAFASTSKHIISTSSIL